jgi:hypothetical protein
MYYRIDRREPLWRANTSSSGAATFRTPRPAHRASRSVHPTLSPITPRRRFPYTRATFLPPTKRRRRRHRRQIGTSHRSADYPRHASHETGFEPRPIPTALSSSEKEWRDGMVAGASQTNDAHFYGHDIRKLWRRRNPTARVWAGIPIYALRGFCQGRHRGLMNSFIFRVLL